MTRIRVSNIARYTANFTAADREVRQRRQHGVSVEFSHWHANRHDGSLSGPGGNPSSNNVFIPIETSKRRRRPQPALHRQSLAERQRHLGDLDAQLDHREHHLSRALDEPVSLSRTTITRTRYAGFSAASVPVAKTNVGFLFMNQSNNNVYDHLAVRRTVFMHRPGERIGALHYARFQRPRVAVFVPLYFVQAQAILDSPELDIEDTRGQPIRQPSIPTAGTPQSLSMADN